MKLHTIPFPDVDNGQFDGLEPASIPAGGWARLVNVLPFRKRLNVRGGTARFTLDAQVSGATDVNTVCVAPGIAGGEAVDYTDEWAMVAAGKSSGFYLISKLGSWVRALTNQIGATFTADDMPWKMELLSGIVYAVRRNAGRMKSLDANDWRGAGRPKPGTFAASAVAGGSLGDTKTYKVSYSFYDSTLGYYGPESDEVTVVTTGANKTISATGVDEPTTAYRADQKAIWCTLANGSRKFLSQYIAAAATTFTITTEPTGEEYSPRHEEPPTDATWWTPWSQRSWWVRGSNLAYSLVGFFESYSPLQELEFDKEDGEDIVVAYPWQNRLVVAKSRKMWYLQGMDRQSWEVHEWAKKIGCAAPHSMEDCDGTLIWKGLDGFYAAGPDSSPANITSDTISTYLEGEDPARRDLAVAEVLPDLGLYICTIPLAAGGWGAVVYNWRSRAWVELSIPIQPPFILRSSDGQGRSRTFATAQAGEQVYAILEGTSDEGGAIVAEGVSAAPANPEGPGFQLGLKEVRLLCAATRYPVTISVYNDGSSTASTSVEARLENDKGWNTVNVSTLRNMAAEAQVGFRFAGKGGWWMSQMAWLVGVTKAARRER